MARIDTRTGTCNAELDTHADTCGVSDIAKILDYTSQIAKVSGFANSLELIQDVPIVKAAVAFDHTDNGRTTILVINQALYFGDKLDNILLNPNQLHYHGLVVDNVPKHLSNGKSTHSILVEEANLRIPLKLNGIILHFVVRSPTLAELEECDLVIITSDYEWSPHSTSFQERENKLREQHLSHDIKSYESHSYYSEIVDDISRQINSTNTNKKSLFVQEAELAQWWAVGETVAREAVKVMMQNFICNALHPVECHYKTKHNMLKYNHLKCKFYSDTFFMDQASLLGNKCTQLFVSEFGFIEFTPMKLSQKLGMLCKSLFGTWEYHPRFIWMVQKSLQWAPGNRYAKNMEY